MSQIFNVSIFPNMLNREDAINSTLAQTVPLTFRELQATICNIGWAPATFNGSRKKANFEQTQIIALDVDGGCNLSEAQSYFGGYKHIIGTSRNHQKEKNGATVDRFRVLLFLSEPIKDEAMFNATFAQLSTRYTFVDLAAKDCSRFFFPCTEIVSANEEGTLLSPVQPPPPPAPKEGAQKGQIYKEGQRGHLSRETKQFLAEGAPPGDWNKALYKVCRDFHQNLYPIEETIENLSKMQNPYFSGGLDENDQNSIISAYSKTPSHPPRFFATLEDENPWGFTVTRPGYKGAPVIDPNHPDNMRHLLEDVMNLSIEKNELKNITEINGRSLTNQDLALIRTQARACRLNPTTEFVMDTLERITVDRAYNPFKRVVEAFGPWDGKTDYIGALFKEVTIDPEHLEHTELFKSYFYKWFVGVCARIYSTDQITHEQNMVLTVKGAQGCGKTRFFQRLKIAPGILNESPVDVQDKDTRLQLLTHCFWVLNELDGITSKADAAAIKALITQTEIKDRAAYDRVFTEGLARVSFAATVNSDDFLRDLTGSRRFLVIPVQKMNAEHSVDMVGVFAQALSLYQSGEVRHWFNTEEIDKVEKFNQLFTVVDRINFVASKVEPGENWATLSDIFDALMPNYNYHSGDLLKLGRLLARAGLPSKRQRRNGEQLRFYKCAIGDLERKISAQKIPVSN